MVINRRKRIDSKYKIAIIIVSAIVILVVLNFTINRKEVTPVELFFKGIINKVQQVIYPSYKKGNNKSVNIYKVEIDSLHKEIEELKKTLELNNFTDYKEINASVLYRNVGYWYDTLTIDKGSNEGIEKNMLVMTYGGIIGRIINVTKYSSDVKLLTSNDQNSRITVGVLYNDKTIYGLISGYDYKTGEILVDNITDDIEMKNGIKVITSGLTDSYPKGIIIGYITNIEKDKYGLSKVIRFNPSANFKDIKYVTVFKRSS
jgi:rod shape-determining protein MreC